MFHEKALSGTSGTLRARRLEACSAGVPVSRSGPTVQIHTSTLSASLCLHTSQSEPVKAAGVPFRTLQGVLKTVTWSGQ